MLELSTMISLNETAGTPLTYVLDHLPEAVILLDRDWRITYANRVARTISRIAPHDLNDKSLWELYPDLLGTDLERGYREAYSLGVTRHAEPFFYEPFDTWFDITISPVPGGLAVYYRDITSIRAAEQARHSAAVELLRVLEATTDAVVTLDREWRFTYLNGNAKRMISPDADLLGASLWTSFPATVYEGSPSVEHLHRAMDEGLTGEFETYYPEPLNLWLHVIARPADDGIIVFFRDITERRKTTAALIQSEKLAAVGRLASSIAHEINNPLEAVTNLIYLANTMAENPETRGYLDLAALEIRRISIIANQTLRFHKQSTRPQSIACADLFSTVLSIYEGKLRNAAILVEKRKRACRPVTCFEGEIRQVLSNLVGNAIDAMPHGGRLLIRSRDATDWRTGRKGIVLTVADTGGGISPVDRARIFEAFFTTKGIAGTGLGLWISAEIVARHQGRILLRSGQQPELHGTIFGLFLPYKTEAIQAA